MAVMATEAFWITGLPRSRTAWFALAMRSSRSHCFHELTARARDFADFKRKWLDGPEPFLGNADSACGLHIARILDEIAPRTLIVERPVAEVAASCRAVFGEPLPGLEAALERLEEALAYQHSLIKRVRFADLNDRDAVEEAAEWLVPWHGVTAVELMPLNVQATAAHVRSLQGLSHSLWHMKEAA